MNVRSFIGPAGSGKTTCLMDALESHLQERPLGDGQRVLAITRMHGARHRLEERLARGAARGLFDCMTMDRLAWMLVARWRDRVVERGMKLPTDLDFDETCRVAASLLGDQDVADWLAKLYPLVVVDEFQDCSDGRLGIVQRLAKTCEVLVAADAFQDLSGESHVAAVEWLESVGERLELDRVHRTSELQLLGAATALRGGQALSAGWGSSFSLVAAQNAKVGASHIARNIHWSRATSMVVLSPTGPTTSAFVRDVLARVAEKPFDLPVKKGTKLPRGQKPKTCGPYRIAWERSAEASEITLREALKLPADPDEKVVEPKFPSADAMPGRHEVEQWIEHSRRVKGKTTFTVSELHDAIGRAVQQHRAHARPSRRLRAMTIQQAKNQEFDEVIVLWPFEVQGNAERLRRLLYNAVSRAKTKALVIVQDFKGDRLGKAPFA